MRKQRKILEAVVVTVVVLALVLPGSMAVTNDVCTSGEIRYKVGSCLKITPREGGYRGDDVMIYSATDGDDRLPSVTKDDAGHTVVTWTHEEDVTTWSMGIAWSSDPTDPMSWDGWEIKLEGIEQIWYCDTAYIVGPEPDDYDGLYGVSMYYDLEQLGWYKIIDITEDPLDPEYWYFSGWDSAATDQVCRCVEDHGYYYEPWNDFYGPICMMIRHFTEGGWDIPGCPSYLNNNFEGQQGSEYFDAQAELLSAPARDCDYAALPDWFHLTWEYHNETTDIDQIVWKKIDPAVEADIEFTPWQEYVADGTNPSIEAFEDTRGVNVAVVYVDNGVVKCVYSHDDGENWEGPVTIADGSYPALRAIGTKLFCAYIDDGDLYLVNSGDGGETWGSAEQINDVSGTVVEEENAVDIHLGGIVWVDERGDDYDIYYDELDVGDPPGAPVIDGQTSGSAGTPYPYTFTSTDPDGDQVSYYIEWGDGDITDWTAFQASGPPGYDESHTWDDQGKYTITAKAKDGFGLVGPEATLKVTMPRSKAISSPFLKFLQQHLNLFPILRYLLGL